MAASKYQLNDFIKTLIRLGVGLEKWYAIVVLLMLTHAFIPLYIQNGYGILITLRSYFWQLNSLIIKCLLLLRWEKTFIVAKQGRLLLVFLGYVWLSHLWSPGPEDSQYHAERVVDTAMFGLYFASRFKLREQTRMLGIALGIGVIFSVIYVVVFPGMAIMNDVEAGLINTWRGVFIHKNTLGRVMVMGSMLFVSNALIAPPKQRLVWLGLFGLAVVLILGCQSKAALVSVFLLLGISPLHRIFRWNLKIAIPLYIILLMVGSLVGFFLANYWGEAMGAIDKDPGMNGRVELWVTILKYINDRLWFGWGYVGFWRGWESKEHAEILRTIVWEPHDGHQGFIDLLIDFGVIGAFLYFLGFFYAFGKAIKFIRSFSSAEGVLPLGFMTYYIIMNITQTQLIPAYTIHFLIYTTIIFTPVIKSEDRKRFLSSDLSR